MEIALEIFHIEFWQILGNHILIVKRFALDRKYIYVEFSNLNLEMKLVERIFEVDIFINSFVAVKGSTVKVLFCCFIRF
jgi:hypothetical protein